MEDKGSRMAMPGWRTVFTTSFAILFADSSGIRKPVTIQPSELAARQIDPATGRRVIDFGVKNWSQTCCESMEVFREGSKTVIQSLCHDAPGRARVNICGNALNRTWTQTSSALTNRISSIPGGPRANTFANQCSPDEMFHPQIYNPPFRRLNNYGNRK